MNSKTTDRIHEQQDHWPYSWTARPLTVFMNSKTTDRIHEQQDHWPYSWTACLPLESSMAATLYATRKLSSIWSRASDRLLQLACIIYHRPGVAIGLVLLLMQCLTNRITIIIMSEFSLACIITTFYFIKWVCNYYWNGKYYVTTQPTTCDHINIKYIWGPHVNHMGTPR